MAINTLPSIVDAMRESGVKRLVMSADGLAIVEVELHDTIPAPPVFMELDAADTETKEPGLCAALGCGEKNGWSMAPNYCRAHGLRMAGVRG